MLGGPTSQLAVFVLLVLSATSVFCLPSAAFPELGVGERIQESNYEWFHHRAPQGLSTFDLSNAMTQHIAILP